MAVPEIPRSPLWVRLQLFCVFIILVAYQLQFQEFFMLKSSGTLCGAQRVPLIARLPFYYGWIILIAGSLGVLASIPGQTMGVSVFTDHLIEALQLSRVGLSSAYMAGTLASSFIIPFAGVLFDRYGARVVASVATLMLSLFLLLLVYSPQLTVGISSLGIPYHIVAMALAVFGFFGIRFFGQGVLTLASRGMVAKWFGPRRGLAVGLMGIITAFGFSYAPQPLQHLINQFGWQHALKLLSAILFFAFLPFVLLMFRSDPASCSLELEQGMSSPTRKTNSNSEDALVSRTLKEAKKDKAFYIILSAMGYWALFNTAFTFHVVSIYQEVGILADQAVKIFLPISIISIAARFLGSYLSDRISIKYIYTAFTLSIGIASVALFDLGSPLGTFMVILGYGIGGGLFGMLNIVTWPKLYGRKHIGALSGFAMSIIVAGSAIGPWIFSVVQRLTNSFTSTGFLGLLWTIGMLLALWFIPFTPSAEK